MAALGGLGILGGLAAFAGVSYVFNDILKSLTIEPKRLEIEKGLSEAQLNLARERLRISEESAGKMIEALRLDKESSREFARELAKVQGEYGIKEAKIAQQAQESLGKSQVVSSALGAQASAVGEGLRGLTQYTPPVEQIQPPPMPQLGSRG